MPGRSPSNVAECIFVRCARRGCPPADSTRRNYSGSSGSLLRHRLSPALATGTFLGDTPHLRCRRERLPRSHPPSRVVAHCSCPESSQISVVSAVQLPCCSCGLWILRL